MGEDLHEKLFPLQLRETHTIKKKLQFGLYAVRVFGISFLELGRSQQHQPQLYYSAQRLLSGHDPLPDCESVQQQPTVESELQALTDTAAGFLIGSRDGGNGLKKLESTSHS